ncbi:hypothetical protein BU25DRAFT_423300 [Macroventuria anomochaeta]|uniref:Uncharacterized protein n=1 Tax=Macroventuria anomochaeta TaxID=301207 RepID=A0ACB6RXF8_9PLEO|nr:uncharacterized protein BU25DRAFT_423300 [Macroventuria anomochaeta]KAF2625614.1 hypothetical protein BU25DRAFT_423300 [Macroventuria anomochaeta]
MYDKASCVVCKGATCWWQISTASNFTCPCSCGEVTFSKATTCRGRAFGRPTSRYVYGSAWRLTDVLLVYARADKFLSAVSAGVEKVGSGMQDDWQNGLAVSPEPWDKMSPAIERLEMCSTTLPFLAGDEHPVKCSPWLLLPRLEDLEVP